MSNQPVYRRPRSHAYSCRCPQCRQAGAYSEDLFKGAALPVAACAVLGGVVWLVLAPLRIWHTIGADGQQHPDTATWIAYGAGGAVIMGALMFFSIRAASRAGR